jgi:hypothetical protein
MEGATTTIYASSTVTDNNGYSDLLQATSTIYRSDLGAMCTHDENNCYQIASTSCSFSGCSGNTCSLQCIAEIQYFADPTDFGTYSAGNWLSRIQVEDTAGERDVDTSLGVELNTLRAIEIDSDIDYVDVAVGDNTGAVNATTTINNTGNSNIDIRLSGTDLDSGQSTIPVNEQKYSTTTFAYGSCSICNFLTGTTTPADVEVDLPKPTSTSTPSIDDVYWGIEIPFGTATILHQGTNYFEAIADE